MTHDELRVDISVVKDLNKLIRKQMKAIDAVFELHKPNILNECEGCSSIKFLAVHRVNYPCPTIQAIEKELA